MVLAVRGLPLSENEIRRRCRQTVVGLTLQDVPRGLSDLPVVATVHRDWSVDDLRDEVRQSNYPIVGVDLRPIDGRFAYHAVVIVKIESDKVSVHDPEPGRGMRELKLATFLSAWKQAGREVLMILLKQTTQKNGSA
jgi:ABC-type bacteriocin/lantibiotic exporter with double-glycine peptidase domain